MVNSIREELEIFDQVTSDILDQVEDVGHSNYYIYKYNSEISTLAKYELRETKLWKIFFDGEKSRNGVGVGVILRYPMEGMKRFSFRINLMCTNI